MDKKSFMRGFGTGVLFAAVILGTSCLMRTSDTAVIRKAKQLGMTYADSDEKLFETAAPKAKTSDAPKETAGASPEAGTASTEPKAAQATAKPESSAGTDQKTAKATSDPDKSASKTQTTDEEFKKEKDKIKKDFDKSTKEFTIHAGEWSYRVSQKLENLGLVSDAKKFDQYLEDNGYSSKIKIGHYTVSKDADFEEIAKEITSK
ncbi:hypothetical protein [Jutongia sp.]